MPLPQTVTAVVYGQPANVCQFPMVLPSSQLILLEEGEIHLHSVLTPRQSLFTGEFAFLRSNAKVSVRNANGPHGKYSAKGLCFGEHEFSNQDPKIKLIGADICCFQAPDEMIEAFHRAFAAFKSRNFPERVQNARFNELIAWSTQCCDCISIDQSELHSNKVKSVLMSDLSHPWRVAEVAAKLGVSEATLRRGLAKEGTCFSVILRESRLETALARIQTSNQSLTEIAYQTGFSSHSHFTDVFRNRFDFPPSHLRERRGKQVIGF